MTLELALPAFLAGIALGLRYKVVILIGAVVLVMLFAIIVGIARADRFLSVILAMAIPGAAIQLGYLAGAQIRATVDDHLIKAFAPKAQACECEAAGDNAKGDGEGVTR
jgi:general stress protein CsbA